jgi:bifunctional non-homologous end joining protein LigD
MEVHVVAFDLLFRNDVDLRPLPLIERKAALAKLVKGVSTIQLSMVDDDGEELFKVAQEHGMEGIVSKRRDLSYRSGTCPHWLKVKCPDWSVANKERYKLFE